MVDKAPKILSLFLDDVFTITFETTSSGRRIEAKFRRYVELLAELESGEGMEVDLERFGTIILSPLLGFPGPRDSIT